MSAKKTPRGCTTAKRSTGISRSSNLQPTPASRRGLGIPHLVLLSYFAKSRRESRNFGPVGVNIRRSALIHLRYRDILQIIRGSFRGQCFGRLSDGVAYDDPIKNFKISCAGCGARDASRRRGARCRAPNAATTRSAISTRKCTDAARWRPSASTGSTRSSSACRAYRGGGTCPRGTGLLSTVFGQRTGSMYAGCQAQGG